MKEKNKKAKPMHHAHKRKLRLRLSSYALFAVGVLAIFGWLYGKADLALVSIGAIVALTAGLVVCAYLHFWAKVAGVLGVALVLMPLVVEGMPYWELFVLGGIAVAYYIWSHE